MQHPKSNNVSFVCSAQSHLARNSTKTQSSGTLPSWLFALKFTVTSSHPLAISRCTFAHWIIPDTYSRLLCNIRCCWSSCDILQSVYSFTVGSWFAGWDAKGVIVLSEEWGCSRRRGSVSFKLISSCFTMIKSTCIWIGYFSLYTSEFASPAPFLCSFNKVIDNFIT